MQLDALIQSFSTGTYTVTRRQGAGFSRGLANSTNNTTLSIVASVQPATGRDLLRLPEGRRTNETRVLFTTTQLNTGDQGSAYEADWVLIDGSQWEVQHRELWLQSQPSMIAWRCIVQEPNEATNP